MYKDSIGILTAQIKPDFQGEGTVDSVNDADIM
jgi:hypothetical protein